MANAATAANAFGNEDTGHVLVPYHPIGGSPSHEPVLWRYPVTLTQCSHSKVQGS